MQPCHEIDPTARRTSWADPTHARARTLSRALHDRDVSSRQPRILCVQVQHIPAAHFSLLASRFSLVTFFFFFYSSLELGTPPPPRRAGVSLAHHAGCSFWVVKRADENSNPDSPDNSHRRLLTTQHPEKLPAPNTQNPTPNILLYMPTSVKPGWWLVARGEQGKATVAHEPLPSFPFPSLPFPPLPDTIRYDTVRYDTIRSQDPDSFLVLALAPTRSYSPLPDSQ